MSFSSDVKKELCSVIPKAIHCRIAELAGVLSVNGRTEYDNNDELLIIRAENEMLEDFIRKLLSIIFKAESEDIILVNEKMHHRKLVISNKELIDDIFIKLKLSRDSNRISVSPVITERSCCKKAYLKGVFIAGGYIGSPEKKYQMEMSLVSDNEAEKILSIISSEHFNGKYSHRRERYIVYIKDGDTISGILGVMGAANSMMEFENIRIFKDIRNVVNREVNCDTANLAKTASAAAKVIDDIKFIRDTAGLDILNDTLRETAVFRLDYPTLSIKELGELFSPAVGKSGMNHRLRKLSQIAEELKNNN